MAQEEVQTGGFSKNEKKIADAYMNIDVIDKDKVEHKFQGFNPLYENGSGKLHRSLVNKARASADGTVTINCKVTIRLAVKDDGADLAI
jgi:hypothetical protein